MKFLLSTDTSVDLPPSQLKECGAGYIPLTFTIGETTTPGDFNSDAEFAEFYDKIRKGAMPVTSQINPEEHREFFCRLIEEGNKAIVHLCLSGGLSSTYNSAVTAAEEVQKSHPGCEIHVIDTINATQAHRFLFEKALKCRNEGKTAAQTAEYLNAAKHNIQVWFVVDDLMHLKRGGRVSAAAAIIGSLLKIKPILIINKIGGLSVVHKAKGMKNAFEYFFERMLKYAPDNYKTTDISIAHSDSIAAARQLEQMLRERGCKGNINIGWIGPIIGAHTGPGAIGFIFDGAPRIQ